jgi:radical SAM family uncharacterized protein/radical SAM-linked protein
MRSEHIQDILPLVEVPSRYLGSEINTVKKDHLKVKLKVALAFPDLYEIGTSHFGLQILYHILNQHPDILAERVFTPAPDMEGFLRKRGLPLQALESGRPLRQFDILGFSLLYELNYTNVLTMLELAQLPFKCEDRDRRHPFVIAGGPCTCNPEPVADFFDAIVIGDGEEVLLQMSDAWIDWHQNSERSREALLEQWSKLTGVYVPALYDPLGGSDHTGIAPSNVTPQRIQRALLADLDGADFPHAPIVPFSRPVHDRLRLELARGCTRGCRFCQAGMIYRPVRERHPETVMRQCEASLAKTGYDDISLLSLSTGDYRCIAPLMEQMIHRYACDHVALSLPSLRAGTLTPELMAHIKTVRKTGFTIAPEAGSQRLRDVINKNITAQDILQTVQDAFGLGWNLIKLYFMIGLPTEKQEDLEELVALARNLSRIKTEGRKKNTINVSVATMIPKPHTPFQWAPQIRIAEGWEKINWIKNTLHSPRIRLKWQNPEVSYIEGLMARGDRRMADLILHAYRKGCRLDGWSDHFRFDLWQESIQEIGLDAEGILYRERASDEVFPWDHIDMRVKRSYLWDEWQQALRGNLTEDCREGACQDCGVCDFAAIKPITHSMKGVKGSPGNEGQREASSIHKFQIFFSKTGKGRFWGHLEMVNIFVRALRRAGIPLKFSEGFHPKPKLVFDDALPIGMESLAETMVVSVEGALAPQELVSRLKAEIPEGLEVTDCRIYTKGEKPVERTVVYRVTLVSDGGAFDPQAVQRFKSAETVLYDKPNRKGQLKKIDLKAMVIRMDIVRADTLEIEILQHPGPLVRPNRILENVFALPSETLRGARVVKLRYGRAHDGTASNGD